MTVSLERVATPTTTPCPAWCDGTHDFLYHVAGDRDVRDHFHEVGRVNDGGRTEIVVGVAATSDPDGYWHAPCVELLHLDLDEDDDGLLGLAAGDAYLTAAEAEQLAPLLVRAAEILRTGRLP